MLWCKTIEAGVTRLLVENLTLSFEGHALVDRMDAANHNVDQACRRAAGGARHHGDDQRQPIHHQRCLR